MQSELDAEAPGAFQFIGVNGIGFESSNALMTDGRTLPWLQDVASENVWITWGVESPRAIWLHKRTETP